MRRAYRTEIHAQARLLLRSGLARTWREALSQADAQFICGAKAKSTGLPCRARPVPGQIRCRLHGGIVREMTPELRALLRAHAATQPRIRGRFAPRAENLAGAAE
jgi:hypothetical protein